MRESAIRIGINNSGVPILLRARNNATKNAVDAAV